nr:hypothetical protein [Trichocoleus sp. FACHB-591]
MRAAPGGDLPAPAGWATSHPIRGSRLWIGGSGWGVGSSTELSAAGDLAYNIAPHALKIPRGWVPNFYLS